MSDFVDFLIVGEGEEGLKSLVEHLRTAAGTTRHIPGLISLENGLLRVDPSPAIADLNLLPEPDFSDFELSEYHSPSPVLPYLSSRGCTWRRCAFCTHQKTYLEYREESPERTAGRLAALQRRYGTSHFSLVDEMIHPVRLGRIAAHLIENRTQLYYSAYARPARFTSELFEKSQNSGLRVVMWGLESASQRVLELMRKGTRISEAAGVIGEAHRAGIWNLLFVLFGFPTETESEWQATVDFLHSHCSEIDALSKSRFILLEGSDTFCRPERYGITRIVDRPQRDPVSIAYDYELSTGLTQEEVTKMFVQCAPRLSGIGKSPWFGQFREHMLLFASHEKTK